TFGHYSGYSPIATTGFTLGTGEILGLSNLTTATDSGPAMANDYFQNDVGAAPLAAFTAQPSSYGSAPSGDKPLRKNYNNSGNPYATNVDDILNLSSPPTNGDVAWQTSGYSLTSLVNATTYQGYTTGPAHWGKTFFISPPDPRAPVGNVPTDTGWLPGDWRQRFFLNSAKTAGLSDNTKLWGPTGTSPSALAPATSSSSVNYYINYAAILRWLKTCGSNPFPNQLRSGRINYYTAIPDTSNPANDSALNTRFYVQAPTDLNERFWKQYIDFVLGVSQTGVSSGVPTYTNTQASTGYGADFNWGTTKISAKPTT